jgi:hypothetical protein
MKRLCFLLFVLTLAAGPCLAQVQYGIKSGLNISDVVITNYINRDAESDFDLKLGLHAGLFGSVALNDKWSLGAELLYSDKGVKARSVVHLRYINSVFLVQYQVNKVLLVEGGGEIGYLFAARSKYGDVSSTWNNKMDVGMDAGIVYLMTPRLHAGLRYYAGFSSVIDVTHIPSSTTPGETIKYQNRVLQVSLYYAIEKRQD